MKTEDLKAILEDEEVMKKIAAKVLDLTVQKQKGGVVCQGYFCDMGDTQLEQQISLWQKHFKANALVADKNVLENVAKEIPLTEEEITQTVLELKTGTKAKAALTETNLIEAARKVLADNAVMARKGGSVMFDIPDLQYCNICGPFNAKNPAAPTVVCKTCGPNNAFRLYDLQCTSCGPNKLNDYIQICKYCGPNNSLREFTHPCGHHDWQCKFTDIIPELDWRVMVEDFNKQLGALQVQLQQIQERLTGR